MSSNGGRLAGKVVLITGTGGGQGRVAAQIFAREGAKVAGCDIVAENQAETERLMQAEGLEMHSTGGVDLADPEQSKAWVDAVAEHFGGIDVLYNNASLPRFAPFPLMSVEDYQFTLRNEIDVMWYPAQAVWPHLVARGGGAITHIGSLAGIIGLRDLPQSAHAATKGAIIGMTAQMAAEGSKDNIRVNCISPGVINSPPVQEILAIGAESPLLPIISKTLNGKPGEAEDIVYAALYFCSDEAKWVSGSHLVVDGGSSVLI
jgi:NAD(P)-dependent dehydrogenase (short-subunit alcohol dehydrogenase family)